LFTSLWRNQTMPIFGSQGVISTITTLVAGQTCQNVVFHNNYSLTVREPPASIADEFMDAIIPAWLDVLSEDATILTVLFEVSDSGAGIPAAPILRVVNQAGVNASEALPPFVAARLQKIPNNALIEPTGHTPVFRSGWVRIAGCPESFQDGGLVSAVGTAPLADLADALLTFAVGSSTFQMQMNRQPDSSEPVEATVPVADIGLWPIFGSQNSRKIVI
jgi:hypothetical protein